MADNGDSGDVSTKEDKGQDKNLEEATVENVETGVSETSVKPLLSTQVVYADQDVNLELTENGICMSGTKGNSSKVKGLNCEWRDVISVVKSEDEKEEPHTILIHHMEKQKNKSFRMKSAAIECTSDNFESVLGTMTEKCQNVPNRPKKLFVLINPIGGNRRGVQVYHQKIGPIFALANCETTVVTSEHAKHAIEIGETHDLTGYDGVICVSGDGLYQEFLEGHIRKLQKEAGIDINDSQAELVKPKIPFCLIPAGSSNGIVRYTNDGVIDLETSALRVLRGEIHPLNVLTVHEGGQLFGICGLAFAVGLIADMIKHSDERRWMRKARYAYSMAACLLKKRRFYDAQIQYILTEDNGASSKQGRNGPAETGWVEHDNKGKLHTNTCFLVSNLVNVGNKTIINPYSKAGYICIDTGCTNWGLFKYARTLIGQNQTNAIPNIEWKDNALAMKIKIIQNDEEEEERKTGQEATEGKTVKDDPKTDGDGDVEARNMPESDTQAEDGGKSDSNDEGKGDAVKASSSNTSESSRSRKQDPQARARDRELEHYIYLDGEIRRCDRLEFECRLHTGFVPMFGCIPTGLPVEE